MATFSWDTFVPEHLAHHWWIWLTCSIYFMPAVIGIQSLQHIWKDNLVLINRIRYAWFIWNAGLSIFSGFGAYYTTPASYHVMFTTNSSCVWIPDDNMWFKAGATGLFLFLFAFSKLIELGDTIFLATLGKPITFLHWYHHLMTAFGCYLIMCDFLPYASVAASVNYLVHTIMYAYYALSSLNIRAPKLVAGLITCIQTAQMVGMLLYMSKQAFNCGWTPALYSAWLLYVLYLILFIQYFVKRYIKNKTA